MIQDHGVVPKLDGITADQHSLSHHGQDPAKIVQLRQVESEIMKLFAGLLTQMRGRKEGDGTLLDSTEVLFGSNLGNANSHAAKNLPVLVAGGGFSHGSHIAYNDKENSPLCNLYVSLLQNMGVETDRFGQSTSTLKWS